MNIVNLFILCMYIAYNKLYAHPVAEINQEHINDGYFYEPPNLTFENNKPQKLKLKVNETLAVRYSDSEISTIKTGFVPGKPHLDYIEIFEDQNNTAKKRDEEVNLHFSEFNSQTESLHPEVKISETFLKAEVFTTHNHELGSSSTEIGKQMLNALNETSTKVPFSAEEVLNQRYDKLKHQQKIAKDVANSPQFGAKPELSAEDILNQRYDKFKLQLQSKQSQEVNLPQTMRNSSEAETSSELSSQCKQPIIIKTESTQVINTFSEATDTATTKPELSSEYSLNQRYDKLRLQAQRENSVAEGIVTTSESATEPQLSAEELLNRLYDKRVGGQQASKPITIYLCDNNYTTTTPISVGISPLAIRTLAG